MISVSKANHPKHSNPNLCYLWRRSRSWTVLWPIRCSKTPKKMFFLSEGTGMQTRKSRDTWSICQLWPWSTKWSRARANRVLAREHIGHSKHPFPTTQEKTLHMDITRWSIPKIRLIIFFAPKDGEALYSQHKQDWELTVAQIMNSLLPNSA